MSAIRAQGPGGQNVNKVSSAIHLRFDIHSSSLPAGLKAKLLRTSDSRISREGVINIKAQSSRSQEQNREQAREKLAAIIRAAVAVRKNRIATKPHAGAKRKRLESKTRRSRLKSQRGKVRDLE